MSSRLSGNRKRKQITGTRKTWHGRSITYFACCYFDCNLDLRFSAVRPIDWNSGWVLSFLGNIVKRITCNTYTQFLWTVCNAIAKRRGGRDEMAMTAPPAAARLTAKSQSPKINHVPFHVTLLILLSSSPSISTFGPRKQRDTGNPLSSLVLFSGKFLPHQKFNHPLVKHCQCFSGGSGTAGEEQGTSSRQQYTQQGKKKNGSRANKKRRERSSVMNRARGWSVYVWLMSWTSFPLISLCPSSSFSLIIYLILGLAFDSAVLRADSFTKRDFPSLIVWFSGVTMTACLQIHPPDRRDGSRGDEEGEKAGDPHRALHGMCSSEDEEDGGEKQAKSLFKIFLSVSSS